MFLWTQTVNTHALRQLLSPGNTPGEGRVHGLTVITGQLARFPSPLAGATLSDPVAEGSYLYGLHCISEGSSFPVVSIVTTNFRSYQFSCDVTRYTIVNQAIFKGEPLTSQTQPGWAEFLYFLSVSQNN